MTSESPNHGIDRRRLLAGAAVSAVVALDQRTTAAQASSTKTYIGHSARLTATIPAHWSLNVDGRLSYRGSDGFVLSSPTGDQPTLDDAAKTVVELIDGAATSTTWNELDARLVEGQYLGEPCRAIVMRHPIPFSLFGLRQRYVALMADIDHFDAIAASISFDAARVTPDLYLSDAIDFVQATAWWGNHLDWEWVRPELLSSLGESTNLESTHTAIDTLLNWLRDAGDNHSQFLYGDGIQDYTTSEGYGFILGGTRILAVYPDSPAGRTGLVAGDVVERVDGGTAPFGYGRDPGFWLGFGTAPWTSPVVLTVRRQQVVDGFEVELAPSSYQMYRPPQGERWLAGSGTSRFRNSGPLVARPSSRRPAMT